MPLYAIVWRGKDINIQLAPHKYGDGKYHMAKRKGEYIHVDFDKIIPRIREGYGLRMSDPSKKHPPGLIMPQSIQGWK
jgi:hypothetical protein